MRRHDTGSGPQRLAEQRPEAASPTLIIDRISKRFGQVDALQDVSLTVQAGELVALLGPNGAGKSTLLRIIGTTILPDRGSVTVGGYDVVQHPQQARTRCGLVLTEDRSWYWRLTGRQNLEFFAAAHGMRSKDAAAEADRLLRIMALDDAADRRVDGYSSGMRTRLSLARAMIGDPDLLLLDEPTRSLDPVVAADVRRRFTALVERAHHAVLFATHDLHEAATLADRVVVLDHGHVVATEQRGKNAEELERLLVDITTDG